MTPPFRTVLFDLDGTLAGMNRGLLELMFTARAIVRLARVIPPWRFRRVLWEAAGVMQRDPTDRTNFDVMVDELLPHARCGRETLVDAIHRTIELDFGKMGRAVSGIPGAPETLELAHSLGYRLVLATNPVFPLAAVQMRMRWGRVDHVPFDFVTHSENMTRCKPRVDYYVELLRRLGEDGRNCLMVGNDPVKDLPAHDVGATTFLLDPTGRLARDLVTTSDPRLDHVGTYEDLRHLLRSNLDKPTTSPRKENR